MDRDGNVEPIQTISRRIVNPRVSPDGDWIALSVYDGIRPSVWLAEAARETLTPFDTEEWSMSPSWMPDGTAISFVTQDEIVLKSLDGGHAVGSVPVAAPYMPWDAVWSSAGDALLTTLDNESFNIDRASLDSGGGPLPFVKTSTFEGLPGFSPDGRWVVYTSTESGRAQVYAQPFEEGAQRHQVSTDGGFDPVWSPGGREIFYRRGAAMISVEVQTEPVFRASTPRVLFEGDFLDHDLPWKRDWDVSPDGKRFLMVQSEEEPVYAKVKIVLNWFEELKRLVPVEN